MSGVPTTTGVFTFSVNVTDSAGLFYEQLCTLQIFNSVTAPAGLIGWWRAEGNAQDSVGVNHGLLQNGAGFSSGKVGQAFSLDGINDFIEITDTPALRPVSLTLEAWVTFNSASGIKVIFAKPLGSGSSDSYALWLNSGTQLNALVCDTVGLGPVINAPFSPALGRLYHVAYTFDDATNIQALYIDGVQAAIGIVTKSISYDAQPLFLGRDSDNGVPNFFHQGLIDEASIYNRALTAAEIESIYNAGPAGKHL